MELMPISIGLKRGLINPELYTVLAIMAVATTVAATPLFLRPKDLQSECPAVDAIDASLVLWGCERGANNSCRGSRY
jgi:hypothetical protein